MEQERKKDCRERIDLDTEALEDRIGHRFTDRQILTEALTHSTYMHEMKQKSGQTVRCNERLEFLGDSVISILVSEYLYRVYFESPEGKLTDLRKYLVCREALAHYSEKIGLGKYLLFGKGEEKRGRQSESILENAFEALAAAVYLDEEAAGRDGRKAVDAYLMSLVQERLAEYGKQDASRDYKTLLQEIVQRAHEDRLSYVQVDESGPDHCKIFTVEARLNDSTCIGRGVGKTKREAEQAAAKQAMNDYFSDFLRE